MKIETRTVEKVSETKKGDSLKKIKKFIKPLFRLAKGKRS